MFTTPAIQLDATLAIAHNILGLILDCQRKTNEDLAAYTKALQLDPTLALAHSNIGVILIKQRQLDLATIKYRQAIRFAPNFYLAHYNLGFIFLKQVKSAQAQAKFQQALCFHPNLKIAKQGLWLAQLQQNKRELLSHGKAAVFRQYPFTIILKKKQIDRPKPLRIKIDPGAKFTGLALVSDTNIVWAAELEHRGFAIREALTPRRNTDTWVKTLVLLCVSAYEPENTYPCKTCHQKAIAL